jgi:hypothetical protein
LFAGRIMGGWCGTRMYMKLLMGKEREKAALPYKAELLFFKIIWGSIK